MNKGMTREELYNLIEAAYEIANKDRSAELMASMHRPSYYDGLLQGALEMAKWQEQHLIDKGIKWLEETFLDNCNDSGRGFYGEIVAHDFDSIEEMLDDFKQNMKRE